MPHAQPAGYDPDGLATDPQRLSGVVAFDAPYLGDLHGKRVVHQQCHIGTDTLSLARLGATVTGLDFSPSALAAARRLFRQAGAEGRFLHSELYDAPRALDGEDFDLVYTGVGALNWLPDINGCARVVASASRPAAGCTCERVTRRCTASMTSGTTTGSSWSTRTSRPPSPSGGRPRPATSTRPRRWTTTSPSSGTTGIGELITWVLDAGLTVTGFTEHTDVKWRALPFMVRNDAGRHVLPDRPERLLLMYTLTARKPQQPG